MKKENLILISIVVPIYNVEEYLPRCIESLINQTYKNIEMILINDGSLDNCSSICDKYKEKDSRIQVIHKENGGLSDARNFGIYASNGKYILFVDSDDFIEEDACERFIKILNDRDADIVVGEAREIKEDNISYMDHSNLINGKEYCSSDYIKYSIKATEWYAPSWLNLYRRKFIVDNSLYFKKGILHEDMEIMPKLFLLADRVIYMQYSFYNYIIREGSITQSKSKLRNMESLLEIFEEWKLIFDKIEDKELKVLLYGILSKQYLYACRDCNMCINKYPKGLNGQFMIKNSLDFKEKIKAIIFVISPRLYIKLAQKIV